MSHIVVLVHEFDLVPRKKLFRKPQTTYMIFQLAEILRKRGHVVTFHQGPENVPEGDVLFYHLDCSVVPAAYLEIAKDFPVTINADAVSIRRDNYSQLVLSRSDDWQGQVIVKTILNNLGKPEFRHNLQAEAAGKPKPHPDIVTIDEYQIYDHMNDVPSFLWSDPDFIVERFVPEQVEGGYAIRSYVFCGDYGRCAQFVSSTSSIKGARITDVRPSEIPQEFFAIREALGIQYGKFDYVIYDGKPHLFDANKSLGSANGNRALQRRITAENEKLVDALEAMFSERSINPAPPTPDRGRTRPRHA